MRHTLRTGAGAAVCAAAAVFAACGDDGGTAPADTGRIEATVRLDDAAAAGVALRLFGGGGGTGLATVTTAASGRASFGGLAAGSYEVEVTPPAGALLASGEAARKGASVAAGGTASVAFDLVSEGSSGDVVVTLTSGLRFDPATVTIDAGTRVVWRNGAAMFHTITPDGHGEWQRATLSQNGQTFTHVFETPGTYAYYCEPHQSAGMTGVITVR